MSVITKTSAPVVLEQASQAFVEATAKPPFLYELTPDEARAVLDDVQAAPIDKLPVEDRWITVPADVGDVRVRIIRPPDAVGTLPVILYMHGGGWVLGNADTHDRLVRELAVGTGAAIVFPSTTARRRRTTPSRSSRDTPRPDGSCAKAQHTSSTPTAWPSPATRSAAA
jgi:hypothetical protein